jgi:hypothetical protein
MYFHTYLLTDSKREKVKSDLRSSSFEAKKCTLLEERHLSSHLGKRPMLKASYKFLVDNSPKIFEQRITLDNSYSVRVN